MVKCPYCRHENQDGTLYCEQCKSDLNMVEVAELATPVEAVPLGGLGEGAPTSPETAQPVETLRETIPFEAEPMTGAMAVKTAPEMEIPEAPPELEGAVTAPAQPQTPPAAPEAAGDRLPPDAQPRLLVQRGQKINTEYPIYEGPNFIGRADEKPVDIDLEDQEPPDRIWSSRQHAVIIYEGGALTIEDLNSSNGTFVNRTKIHPGQKCPLKANDIIQIGTVQMRVKV